MRKDQRNVKVVAMLKDDYQNSPLEIYLDYSGRRELLMVHRWDEQLHRLLKMEITLKTLERNAQKVLQSMSMKGRRYIRKSQKNKQGYRRNRVRQFENSVNYVIRAAEAHIAAENGFSNTSAA